MHATTQSSEDTLHLHSTVGLKRYSGPRGLWPWNWLCVVVSMLGLGAYVLLIYAPQYDRPHAFTSLAMLYAAGLVGCVLFSALLIGLRLIALLKATDALTPLEMVAIGAGLGLGAVSLGVLALGMLHLYYAAVFAVLLIGIPFAFPGERHWLAFQTSLLVNNAWQWQWRRAKPRDLLGCLILGGICLSAFTLIFLRDLTPPSANYGYDTYQYHWAIPALLIRNHGWEGFPGWAHANLPFNTEMLNLIALSLQSPKAAALLQDSFGLLFALLIFALVRQAFGVIPALLAVAAAATMPVFAVYSSQSYVETALIYFGFATLVALIRWLERLFVFHEIRYSLLALAGALYGLAVGVKYTAIEYAPALCLALIIGLTYAAWSAARHALVGVASRGTSIRTAGGVVAGGSVLFGAGFLMAYMPWAIKNWLLLGNPVYPALASLFGASAWNATRDLALESTFRSFGPHAGLVSRFHLYGIDVFLQWERYGEGVGYPTGLLFPLATLLLVAYAAGLKRNGQGASERAALQMALLGVLALCACLGLATWALSGTLVERYALPMISLVTVLGAVLMGWLITRGSRGGQALSIILLLLLALHLASQERAYLYNDFKARSPLPLVSGQMSEDQFMRTKSGSGLSQEYWQMTDYLNQTLPHDGKLLMLGRGTGYLIQRRDYVADSGGDWVPYLVSEGKTPDGILHILHAQGFTYVVYDGRLMNFLVRTYHNDVLAANLPTYLDFQGTTSSPSRSGGHCHSIACQQADTQVICQMLLGAVPHQGN